MKKLDAAIQRQTIFYIVTMALTIVGLSATAAPVEEYGREQQNIPLADRQPDQIDGLLFYLQSDAGIDTDDAGAVRRWADQSGNENHFTTLPRAKKPPRLTGNVIGDKPAVSFAASQHKSGGLLSQPVRIDPKQGMTLAILARVSVPVHIGYLLCYGSQHKTPGSMGIGLTGYASYNRCWWRASVDSTSTVKSTDDRIAGRGFVFFVARYDPEKEQLSIYQDGVLVGRQACTSPLAEAHRFSVGVEPRGQWSLGGEVLAALAFNRALDQNELSAVQRSVSNSYGLSASSITALARRLPFAYYPSRNQMEVAIELSPELLAKARAGTDPLDVVGVRILDAQTDRLMATGAVPLDNQSRGQAIFDVPDLPDGEYAVEYTIGQHAERSPKTFERIHFPFEQTSYGQTHKVYPPFTPVQVHGKTVSIVDRTYTVNAQGLFDSVVSMNRELLAAPMRLVATDTDGKPVIWQTNKSQSGVEGRALHPDEAVFHTSTSGVHIRINSKVTVQEDGCAQIDMTLSPVANSDAPPTLNSLAIEIPLQDAEVPLFHYVADNGMRFNYAGHTPRGGRIAWYHEPWDGWVPQRWRVAESGTDDGVIWTSANTRQHGTPVKWDHRPFVPYLWLGAEQRGLAFFMESERGFETDYRTPIQKVIRDGDQVIVRVEVFQQPVTLTGSRIITFGLMASPGKPMEPQFRTRPFASGVGPVVCWGGWLCSSKYPDNHDWALVDRIQDIRRRGAMTAEDHAWLETRYEAIKKRWPGRKVNGSNDWLWLTKHFAGRAASNGRTRSGVYFEEHATDVRLPEWEVFQDEWASAEFNRFQDKPANWGVFSPSYHDFTLYMANEWMKRGVSLYFDNTNPKRCYNERFGPAYRGRDGALRYGISIFGQRAYYRRIYKLLSEWNERGVEYPIDFTLHITNTQTLPFNTWATATLDLEQRAHTANPEEFPPEVVITLQEPKAQPGRTISEADRKRHEAKKKRLERAGFQLPWSPDYMRTVTFGRQVGVIPLALDFVSGHGRHYAKQFTPQMMLRDWAMRRIHDIRPGTMWSPSAVLSRAYEKVLNDFGYGRIDRVDHHNYWANSPYVRVNDQRVRWLALTRRDKTVDPFGLLLLQSYARHESVTVDVTFPGADSFVDIQSGERIATSAGRASIQMSENFGTRLFHVVASPVE